MNTENMIRCRVCGELKPISDFPASPRTKSGHISICKTCQGARISAGRKTSNIAPPQYFTL